MDHDNFDPEYVFSHHPATPKKLEDFAAIHDGAKAFAQVLLDHVPERAALSGDRVRATSAR